MRNRELSRTEQKQAAQAVRTQELHPELRTYKIAFGAGVFLVTALLVFPIPIPEQWQLVDNCARGLSVIKWFFVFAIPLGVGIAAILRRVRDA